MLHRAHINRLAAWAQASMEWDDLFNGREMHAGNWRQFVTTIMRHEDCAPMCRRVVMALMLRYPDVYQEGDGGHPRDPEQGIVYYLMDDVSTPLRRLTQEWRRQWERDERERYRMLAVLPGGG